MRIRSIKPEFWRSDDITSLPVEDRLLFIGLWSYVDDNGVGRDDLSAIVADLFARDMFTNPRETVARVQRGLERFESDGMIRRYTVDGRGYLHITTWTKHQKIDRPSHPRYPGPDQADHFDSPRAREDDTSPRYILDAGTGDQGAEEQGISKDFSDLRSDDGPSNALARIPASKPPARTDTKYPADFEQFWQTYPRHEGKGDALKAWNAAKRLAALNDILAAAARYSSDPNRDPQYTKLPATWLRGRGWDDDPLPHRGAQGQSERVRDSVGQMWDDVRRMGA